MKVSPQERARAARIRRQRAARRKAETITLADFVREAWHVLEPATPLVWGWHMGAICAHLEAVTDGRIKRLIINVPPGHSKSLLVSVFWPAWMWLTRPDLRYLAVTHSQTLSLRDAVRMRTLITSDWYRRTYAPEWTLRDDVSAKGLFETTETGHRLSIGVTGNVTGHRGDGIIIDDPLGVEAAYSDAEREEANRIIRETLPTRLNSLVDGWMVLIMQRLHEDDPTGMLMGLDAGWELLSLPSEYDPDRPCETSIGFCDPRSEAGELLFPERFPRQTLEALKRILGSLAYSAQHDQRPAPAEGLLFKSNWFGRVPLAQFPTRPEQRIMSCDLSFGSTKETASRVSIGLWHYHGGRLYRVAEVVRVMSYTETRATIERLHAQWSEPPLVLVESKANGPAIIDDLRSVIPGMVPVETGARSKIQRAVAVLPMCEAGNVVIPSDASWAEAYLHELTTFPRARHDDRVDETSQVLSRFIRPPSVMPEQTQASANGLASMHPRTPIGF